MLTLQDPEYYKVHTRYTFFG